MRNIVSIKYYWLLLFPICSSQIDKRYEPTVSVIVFGGLLIAFYDLIYQNRNEKRYVSAFLALSMGSLFLLTEDIHTIIKCLLMTYCVNLLLKERKQNIYVYGTIVAGINFLVDIVFAIFAQSTTDIVRKLIEFFLVLAGSLIFAEGIRILMDDYVSITVEGKNAICVFGVMTVFFFGLPMQFLNMSILLTFALLWTLISAWQFGFGVGTAYAIGTCLVLDYRLEYSHFVSAYMLLFFITISAWEIFHTTKMIASLCFLVTYAILGRYYYEFLFDEAFIKACLSSWFVFAFLPNNLVYRIDKKVISGEIGIDSSEWGNLLIERVKMLANAFKRIDYIFTNEQYVKLGFADVGDIILDYTDVYGKATPIKKTTENAIINELMQKGIMTKNIIMTKNPAGRYQIFVTAKSIKGKLLPAERLKKVVENNVSFMLKFSRDARYLLSRDYRTFMLEQAPMYKLDTCVKKISKLENEVSGDNFYIGDISGGQQVVLLSDGMGNGEQAASFSELIVDSLEELLSVGFDKDTSVKLVNNYLAEKTKGEQFSTLDMLVLDLHTGFGQFYKQGSATTFVKRGKWIEIIKSTSLPMGVIPENYCEVTDRKFYENDIIIMMSDGVLDNILFENKEDYIKELILETADCDAEAIGETLADKILIKGKKVHGDDATILVCKVVKSL